MKLWHGSLFRRHRRTTGSRRTATGLAVAAVVSGTAIAGCSGHHEWYPLDNDRSSAPSDRDLDGGASSLAGDAGLDDGHDHSNGRRIYQTGKSAEGPITTTGGPHWFLMHGGGCADCHGEEGHGGEVVHMTNETAPDIRYSALTSPEHEHESAMTDPTDESGPGEAAETHAPYTDALIRRAITDGLDPAGEPLDDAMPRWDLSETELEDLLEYLRILDTHAE